MVKLIVQSNLCTVSRIAAKRFGCFDVTSVVAYYQLLYIPKKFWHVFVIKSI